MDVMAVLTFIFMGIATIFAILHFKRWFAKKDERTGSLPVRQYTELISVNFHFTRKCNYTCGFCFHTAKTSYVLPFEDIQRGLRILAAGGMKKLNLSGGEPFLYPKLIGQIVTFCKRDLRLESVSIVSNGSKIRESWFKRYGAMLDILAVSCDSFREETNQAIGRGHGDHVEQLERVAGWCRDYGVLFKLNTVVNRYNWEEDMNAEVTRLAPVRWKVFQCLVVDTENEGADAIRNAKQFLISDQEYESFCERHEKFQGKVLVREPNRVMKSSYIILDEYMRFLNKGDKYEESPSILEVPLEKALDKIDFDRATFEERQGIYDWSRSKVMPGILDW